MCLLKCSIDNIKFNNNSNLQIKCQLTQNNLNMAAKSVLKGKIVAFPTETVYGLGANAFDGSAVKSIFKAKGRPNDNPLIVHISNFNMFEKFFNQPLPLTYQKLIKEFWPGPLTILVRSPSSLPKETTASLSTVGLRMPSNVIARALIEISGVPLAAPSANSSGKPSPTKAQHVLNDTYQRSEAKEVIDYIIDGGNSFVGLESTVIDGISVPGKIKVLRPGGITLEHLKNSIGEDNVIYEKPTKVSEDFKPLTPGLKYKHYSPKAKVLIFLPNTSNNQTTDPIQFISNLPKEQHIGCMTLTDSNLTNNLFNQNNFNNHNLIPYILGPNSNPSEIARNVFDGLHYLDSLNVDLIIVEGVKEENEGLAIMNRLFKAAGDTSNIYYI